MADEYKLLAHLPFADLEAEAVDRIATALELPVSRGPEGAPEISTETFLAYGFLPDEVDRAAVSELFDLDINLTLVVTDPDEVAQKLSPVSQNMMKVAVLLAAVKGARGLIVTDYTADAIVLRFQDGQVTLNQNWPGWQDQPDVLTVIPEPRTMQSLQGRS